MWYNTPRALLKITNSPPSEIAVTFLQPSEPPPPPYLSMSSSGYDLMSVTLPSKEISCLKMSPLEIKIKESVISSTPPPPYTMTRPWQSTAANPSPILTSPTVPTYCPAGSPPPP
jgi:hypothetical protein